MFEKKPSIKIVELEPDSYEPRIYHVKSMTSDMLEEGMTGTTLIYKTRFNRKSLLFVPFDYKWFEPGDGYRYVGKISGNNSPAPISRLPVTRSKWLIGDPIDPETPGHSMDLLFANEYGARQGKAMKGKADFPFMWLIIGIVIIAVMFFGYKMLNPDKGTGKQTTVQGQTK